MKRFLTLLACAFAIGTIQPTYADDNSLPHEPMYIKQHWISATTGYDVETKTQKLGTVYRRFLSLLLKYDFYDPFENKIATAKSKFFSLSAHFDIVDNNEQLLGSADESLFAFFPTFSIYAADNVTKLATAKMNFWGTTFYVYDPITDKEMAQLYRPFFRLKNDWTFEVTDEAVFNSKNIDKRVLLTIIAFQGDREYWESQRSNNYTYSSFNASATSTKNINIQSTLAIIAKQFKPNFKVNRTALNTMSKTVEQAYLAQMKGTTAATTTREEQVQEYIKFCLQFAKDPNLSEQDKQNILYLLKTRLQTANAQ